MVQRMWKQEQGHWGSSARGWILEWTTILEDLNHFPHLSEGVDVQPLICFSNLCPSLTLYSHEEDYDNENKDVQKEAAKKKWQ